MRTLCDAYHKEFESHKRSVLDLSQDEGCKILKFLFLCIPEQNCPKAMPVERKPCVMSCCKCLFSAECTIGMVWGLTTLKHYGNKAL